MFFLFLEVPAKIVAKALKENQTILRNIPQASNIPQSPNSINRKERAEFTSFTLASSNTNTGHCRGSDRRRKKSLPVLPKRRPTLLEMVKDLCLLNYGCLPHKGLTLTIHESYYSINLSILAAALLR